MSCWAKKEFQKMISRRWIMPSSKTSVSTATRASMTCCRRTGTIFWISPTRISPRRNDLKNRSSKSEFQKKSQCRSPQKRRSESTQDTFIPAAAAVSDLEIRAAFGFRQLGFRQFGFRNSGQFTRTDLPESCRPELAVELFPHAKLSLLRA